MTDSMELRYGINPHQAPARIHIDGDLPIKMVNGQPGYINLMDALNSWQLVKELKDALGLPAAASFKHVSPAGAAVARPLSDTLRKAYFVGDAELSPLATAYARARGADRVSSFGDWIALSDIVDESTARLIKREVSDGVIAPGYTPEALAILMKKKKGQYRIIEVDESFVPAEITTQQIMGITLEQKRNDYVPTSADLSNVVTAKTDIPDNVKEDMILALITLKYTQSNSVCFANDGQIIGVGAGQQSRVHCTRLAASKASNWFLRQHPTVLNLPFREKIGRPERDNAIDQFLLQTLSPNEESAWLQSFAEAPVRLTEAEKAEWLSQQKGATLGSDAFFPFRDSIDCASQYGISYVIQPGGSIRDDIVIDACNEYGMVMACNGVRLFHH